MFKTTTIALPTGTWAVDTDSSTASFIVEEKFGTAVRGNIPVITGTVAVASGEVVTVEAELNLAGIDTGHARRDKDLRGKHFFHTAARPTMRFTAGTATPNAEGWSLVGVLHVNDCECPVQLAVRVDSASDPAGGMTRVFASGVIDKRAAGIKAPNFLIRHRVVIELAATLRLA